MIYFTGDIHGDWYDFTTINLFDGLTSSDTLVVCGDFGFTWDKVTINDWQNFKHPYTVCFVRGNHDNTDVLHSLPIVKKFNDEVGDFGNNTYWLLDGHMYEIEGKKLFCFGGASSIDKSWRVLEEMRMGVTRTLWWSDEAPSEETYELALDTLKNHDYRFDYFVTHSCNPCIKCNVLGSWKLDFFDHTETMIQGLEYAIETNGGDYKTHYFGHFHDNLDYKKECCLYDRVVKGG